MASRHLSSRRSRSAATGNPWVTVWWAPAPTARLTALKAQVRAYASRMENADLVVPAGQRARYEAAFAQFSSVFPDAFYMRERGRFYPDDSEDKGRLLSAGFHNVMGYSRDDAPLSELILDEKGQKELEALWDQFEFIADYTARTWVQYYFNQSGEVLGNGPESGTLRPSDKEVTAEAVDHRVSRRVPRQGRGRRQERSHRVAGDRRSLRARERHAALDRTRANRSGAAAPGRADDVRRARLSPAAVAGGARGSAGLLPLAAGDEESDARRGDARLDSQRADVAELLLSPRSDRWRATRGAVSPSRTRCSDCLVRLCPGQPPELFPLVHACPTPSSWRARRPGVSHGHGPSRQIRRMLKDDRARGLATEFAGNWLDFRRFEETTPSIASASRPSTTSCARRCSRSRSGSSRT